MGQDNKIQHILSKHLEGGEAFLTLEAMLKDFPFEKIGDRPPNVPYSIYQLFYHIQFAQKDILEYCTSTNYKSYEWPQDYWPQQNAPNSEQEWEDLKARYFQERKHLNQYLLEGNQSLLSPVREGTNHSLLREILLVIEHTAYHTGQILIVMRLLGLYGTGNDLD